MRFICQLQTVLLAVTKTLRFYQLIWVQVGLQTAKNIRSVILKKNIIFSTKLICSITLFLLLLMLTYAQYYSYEELVFIFMVMLFHQLTLFSAVNLMFSN